MKSFLSFLLSAGLGVLCLTSSISPQYSPGTPAVDSLPAGTRISIQIQQPGDATANTINYIIPAPAKPVVVDPSTIALSDGLVIGERGTSKLVVRVWNGKAYLTEQLIGGQILVRGPNLLTEKGVTSAFKSRGRELSGGATAFGGLTEPAGVVAPSGYVRKTFKDGAVYYEVGTGTSEPVVPVIPTQPITPVTPVPDEPKGNQGNQGNVVQGPRGTLNRTNRPSRFSAQPYGYNRTSVQHPAYQDGWVLKASEIAVRNAPGFPDETPESLKRSGQNMFDATWYYGSDRPFGLPKKDDELFFEVTGNNWNPYRTGYDVLSSDLQTIGESLTRTLPQWNTASENGLIDGVPTAKECHFNLEYAWFSEADNGANNNWQSLSAEQRRRRFFNYASNREESFQEVYDRGGADAINEALHQKWRNIYGLSIQIINRHSKPMRAYYGDGNGIVDMVSINNWDRPYPISDLLNGDVNDASRFFLANEGMNAGRVVLNGNDVYDVSGNLRELAGRSHVYNYEWSVNMTAADYAAFSAQRTPGSILDWQDKMVPDLYRPYDRALHAMLIAHVKEKKGWNDYKVYWQSEPIYEGNMWVEGRSEGMWIPWTLNAQTPFAPAKIPLHPEVAADIVYHSRMRLDGLFLWGSYRQQNLPAGKSENTSPYAHQLGREGFQVALDEINSIDVFGPDTKRYTGTVSIYNEVTGQYVTGDPSRLLLANGRQNGKPYKPVPLVTASYRPSTGVELYYVYAVHTARYEQSTVKFRSVVDGAELTAKATGWGPSLYVRQGQAR